MLFKKRNTAWIITASAPLLRPGLSISITVSEKYVVEETLKLIEKVREINAPPVIHEEEPNMDGMSQQG